MAPVPLTRVHNGKCPPRHRCPLQMCKATQLNRGHQETKTPPVPGDWEVSNPHRDKHKQSDCQIHQQLQRSVGRSDGWITMLSKLKGKPVMHMLYLHLQGEPRWPSCYLQEANINPWAKRLRAHRATCLGRGPISGERAGQAMAQESVDERARGTSAPRTRAALIKVLSRGTAHGARPQPLRPARYSLGAPRCGRDARFASRSPPSRRCGSAPRSRPPQRQSPSCQLAQPFLPLLPSHMRPNGRTWGRNATAPGGL
nr:uncharacterized protein LOC105884064 [Microcebus murinus]XP_012643222.1 uncharacterized protein LOC105884064 [Microcebus murinus]